jgi:hypothetical protein
MKKVFILMALSAATVILTHGCGEKSSYVNKQDIEEGKLVFKLYISAAIANGYINDKKFEKVKEFAAENYNYTNIADRVLKDFYENTNDYRVDGKATDKSFLENIESFINGDNSNSSKKAFELIYKIFDKLPSAKSFSFEKFTRIGEVERNGKEFNVVSARSKKYQDWTLKIGRTPIDARDQGAYSIYFEVKYDQKIEL